MQSFKALLAKTAAAVAVLAFFFLVSFIATFMGKLIDSLL
jgi:hypothetical protein